MQSIAKITTIKSPVKPSCTIEFEDLTDPRQRDVLGKIIELLRREGYSAKLRGTKHAED